MTDIYRPRLGLRVRVMRALAREGTARKYAAMNHDEHMEWQRRLAEHQDDMAQHLAYADFLEEHDLPHVAAHVRKAVEYMEKGLPDELAVTDTNAHTINNSPISSSRRIMWGHGYGTTDLNNGLYFRIKHLRSKNYGSPVVEVGVAPNLIRGNDPDEFPSSYFVPMHPDDAHRFADKLAPVFRNEFKDALRRFTYPPPKPQ